METKKLWQWNAASGHTSIDWVSIEKLGLAGLNIDLIKFRAITSV